MRFLQILPLSFFHISFLRQYWFVIGDRAHMRPARGDPYGIGARLSRLADGGWLETGAVHALYRPRCAPASALRYHSAAGVLCC